MSDNKIVSINIGSPGEPGWAEKRKPSQRELLLDMLANLVEYIEMAPPEERFAVALLHEDSEGSNVLCGGFNDNQAAGKYLAAYMRNNGFADA